MIIYSTRVYDIPFPGKPSKNGNKISIQGKSIEDVLDDGMNIFQK